MKPWLSRKIQIPVYGWAVWFGVADRLKDFRLRVQQLFKSDLEITEDMGALSLHGGGRFALLFERVNLRHEIVGHEVFHLTHQIMAYAEDKFDQSHDEPYAYLNGWITAQFYRRVERAGYRVIH